MATGSGTTYESRQKAKVAIERGKSTIQEEIGKGAITERQAKREGLLPKIIDSNALTPETPIKVTQPLPLTEGASLNGQIQGQQDSLTEYLKSQKDTTGKNLANISNAYLDSILGTKGPVELESELYSQKGGVDEIDKELNRINSDMMAEDKSLMMTLDELEKNKEGFFGGALQDEINRVKTDSYKRKAYLAIEQMSIQGRYDSAKAIADRAIAVQMEKQNRENEALRFMYEDNRDLFNRQEERLFNVMLSDRERKARKEEDNLKAIRDIGLEVAKEGGSHLLPQIFNAKTPEEAMSIGGGYIGLMARSQFELQRAKMVSEAGAKSAEELEELENDRSEVLSTLNIVNNLLGSGQVENVVGINKLNPFNYIPGTKVQYAKNQFQQVKDLLSLDNREKLKGSGAISDFEARTLARAASSLGTNLENKDADRELKQVRGALGNAAGLSMPVKITDPTTGQSVTVNANREVINQAIADGANVEYQ